MPPLRRLGKIAAWTGGGLVYVWFAAVLNSDRVKTRKAARRAARQAGRVPRS